MPHCMPLKTLPIRYFKASQASYSFFSQVGPVAWGKCLAKISVNNGWKAILDRRLYASSKQSHWVWLIVHSSGKVFKQNAYEKDFTCAKLSLSYYHLDSNDRVKNLAKVLWMLLFVSGIFYHNGKVNNLFCYSWDHWKIDSFPVVYLFTGLFYCNKTAHNDGTYVLRTVTNKIHVIISI